MLLPSSGVPRSRDREARESSGGEPLPGGGYQRWLAAEQRGEPGGWSAAAGRLLASAA